MPRKGVCGCIVNLVTLTRYSNLTNISSRTRPAWQLPPGVSRGTWDYLRSPSIADDYDQYFSDHPLLKLDIEVTRRFLPPSGSEPVVADFGCGTARVARALTPEGYRVLNVDLSRNMLLQATCSNAAHADRSSCVLGNLAQLEFLRDGSLQAAVCLFSSIGMIRGRDNRKQFLTHVARSLASGARFILHVHNRLSSLFDPGGPGWLLRTRLKSWFNQDWEYGDRVYAYRGLPAMYLHIYSRKELVDDLQTSGFSKPQILPINSTSSELLPPNTRFSTVRAGGFFSIAYRQ
jgi:SAM-dependent methyltransferase